MRVTITLETGEHITGEVFSLEVRHAYSDAYVKVHPVEIDAITFDDLGTTLYPNAEPLESQAKR